MDDGQNRVGVMPVSGAIVGQPDLDGVQRRFVVSFVTLGVKKTDRDAVERLPSLQEARPSSPCEVVDVVDLVTLAPPGADLPLLDANAARTHDHTLRDVQGDVVRAEVRIEFALRV